MKAIKNELLFRNLVHCYNEQAQIIINKYNLQLFYNKKNDDTNLDIYVRKDN